MELLVSLAKEAHVAVLITDGNARHCCGPTRSSICATANSSTVSDGGRAKVYSFPKADRADRADAYLERLRKDYESPAGISTGHDVSLRVLRPRVIVSFARAARQDDLVRSRRRTSPR